jgi:hypothetical protein
MGNRCITNPEVSTWIREFNTYYASVTRKLSSLQIRSATTEKDKLLLREIKALTSNLDIVIKAADKNLGTVVMHRTTYEDMVMKHLNDQSTYQLIGPTAEFNIHNVFQTIREALDNHAVLTRTIAYPDRVYKKLTTFASRLLHHEDSKQINPSNFYCAPKMHKATLSGRPIAPAINTPTYLTSVWLHRCLYPLAKALPTVCLSSQDFVIKTTTMQLPPDTVLLTADIESLYPNIDIQFGLNTIKDFLLQAQKFSSDENHLIMDMLTVVLYNNYVQFNGTVYKQISGTAMGTPVAVAYSIIVVFRIERDIIHNIVFYSRFIDDVITGFRAQQHLQQFIQDFNSQDPTGRIHFDPTSIVVGDKGIFLDVTASLTLSADKSATTISTSIYQKPANKYLYLHGRSKHSKTILRNLVRTEITRYRLNCSHDKDFYNSIQLLYQRLLNRGHSASSLLPYFTNYPNRETIIKELKAKQQMKATEKPLKQLIFIKCLPQTFNQPSLANIIAIPKYLSDLKEFKACFASSSIKIGTKNYPNLGKMLIRAKYPRNRKRPATEEAHIII